MLDISQPTDMVNQPIPPQDGTELQQRKSGWKTYLQSMNDPNMRQAIMQTGLGLMKSPGYGQNGWDTASNALQGGVQTLQQLRERDRVLGLEAQDRANKTAQQAVDNKRAERQVAATEQNAATNVRATDASITQAANANNRAGFQTEETIRHNKASEENDRIRALADKDKAGKYGNGSGHTSAEIEKINRLKKYYMEKQGLDELEADKRAMDYVSTAKGKSPRQLVIDAFQKKVKAWQDAQYDPNASLTPQQAQQMQQDATNEVKMAEEAGQDISNTRGVVDRSKETPPAGAAPPAAAPPVGTKDPLTERNVKIWKDAGGTPEQIRELLKNRQVDPTVYGY